MSRIEEERHRLGIGAQSDVYKKINISRGGYGLWVKGRSIPSDKLEELHRLGFDIHYIVTGQRKRVDMEKFLLCADLLDEALRGNGESLSLKETIKVVCFLVDEMILNGVKPTKESVSRLISLVK